MANSFMNRIPPNYHKQPALFVFFLFSVGIAISYIFLDHLEENDLLIALTGLFVLMIPGMINPKWQLTYIFLCFFCVSGIYSGFQSLAMFPEQHLIHVRPHKIDQVQGWVCEAHYHRDGRHKYLIECEKVWVDSVPHTISGKFLLYQGKLEGRLQYGQRIRFKGPLSQIPLPANPGEFNLRRYWQMKAVYYQTYLPQDIFVSNQLRGSFWQHNLIQPARQKMIQSINKHIDSPTRDVILALVLGERQDVDRSIMSRFQKTGIVHVLAISGLHVGFILMIFLLVFQIMRFNYQWRVLLSLFFLLLFVALVNFKTPVVRASLMAAIYFAARLTERSTTSLNIIGVSGLLILFFDPLQLFQPGFQFSFAAVGAILYGYPSLSRRFPMKNNGWLIYINKFIYTPFLVSLSAVLGTLPLTWYYYGTLQTGALIFNIFIIPLIGAFVIMAFIFLFLSLLGFPAIEGLAGILELYFELLLRLVDGGSRIPFIQLELPHPGILELIAVIILIFIIFSIRGKSGLIYGASIILYLIASLNQFWIEDQKELRITFVNVGQGDCIITQFPSGKVMVVDAGDRKPGFDAGERYIVPLLKHYNISHIHYLVNTHWHSDHIGGFLSVLESCKVDTLVCSPYPGKSKLFKQVLERAASEKIPVVYKRRGDMLYSGAQSRVYVMHPSGKYAIGKTFSGHEVNNSSLVLRVVYGDTQFLLTGDLEADAETVLLNYAEFLDADLLKIGHHGSITSTSNAFLEWVQPERSIVSVGRGNRFFHPSRKTMKRLLDAQAGPLRTDHFGGMVFTSNGEEVKQIFWR